VLERVVAVCVDAGADLRYYTFYAHLAGGPTAIGVGGDNRVLAVMSFGENVAPEIGNKEAEAFSEGFRAKHKFDFSAAGFRTIDGQSDLPAARQVLSALLARACCAMRSRRSGVGKPAGSAMTRSLIPDLPMRCAR
jgi:hypothetical protein